ncbi:MAG: NAD-dependent epimerase/dehydratase, partial [Nitrospirae bacterium]|nr:NAD-dependent epimerase/dehydratase [Nitrospirota bacterium]
SHLLEGLLNENYKVVIIKRSFSNAWRIEHLLHKLRYYDADKESLEKVFKENEIDVVIHTATTYGRKGENHAAIIESNLLLPVKLLELSISHGTSSFFNTDSFFNTSSLNYKYLSGYSISKRQLVEWLQLISDKIQIVNLKLEHLYGPKDSNNKFVIWLITQCIKDEPELKLTAGEQKRDFIYVSDAVSAFLLTLRKRGQLSNYSEFEVGTGEGISIRDFAIKVKEKVSFVSGREVRTILNFGAIPYRAGECMERKADNSFLRQIGWNWSVSLNDGLEKTIKEMIDHGKIKNETL